MRMQAEWQVPGAYGVWELRISCREGGPQECLAVPPGELWPAERIAAFAEQFRQLIDSHELSLEQFDHLKLGYLTSH